MDACHLSVKMRRNKNKILRLLLLMIVVFVLIGVAMLFIDEFQPCRSECEAFSDPDRRHIPAAVEYLEKVTDTPGTLIKALKEQRDALSEELIEMSKNLGESSSDNVLNTLKKQRDGLAEMLNELKQKLGRLDCEASVNKTNDFGGWCRNASMEHGGEHMTDMELVRRLSTFLKGKSVGSFGDGPGAYKREMEKLGEVRLYDAYDGAPFCEETSEGRVKFLDLTVPQYGLPIYDWIVSLEVAEHIPSKYEAVYIDNLARHCKEGIIMSWATPGQGGLNHINKRPPEYAIRKIEEQGFKLDTFQSFRLRVHSMFPWLVSHINVFYRKESKYVSNLETWFT